MPDRAAQGVTRDEPGHNISEGRNVIAPGGNYKGTDIFFAAVQMSRMPMCLTDPHQHDDPIIFCNQAFEQLTGYNQAEIIGCNCRFLQGKETDPGAVPTRGCPSRGGSSTTTRRSTSTPRSPTATASWTRWPARACR